MFASVGNWEDSEDIEDVASVGNRNRIITHIEDVCRSWGTPGGSRMAGDEQAM